MNKNEMHLMVVDSEAFFGKYHLGTCERISGD